MDHKIRSHSHAGSRGIVLDDSSALRNEQANGRILCRRELIVALYLARGRDGVINVDTTLKQYNYYFGVGLSNVYYVQGPRW